MARAADLDLGDINPYRGKQAEMLTPAEKQARDLDRSGLRDLDRRTENLPGMIEQTEDRTGPRPRTDQGETRVPQGVHQ